MAKIANPRKKFQFTISIPGLNPFLAQRVTVSSVELDQATHGDTGYEVKTAGMKKVGMLTVHKISRSEQFDNWVWDWVDRIMNTRVGGGEIPDLYKTFIMVEQYANDGETVMHRWFHYGCWPQKINGVEFSRVDSDNTIEEIDFCVDDVRTRP